MLEVLPELACAIHTHALCSYQRNDDLAIRVCLEVVWLLQSFAENTVIVDFAIDG
jgi:hypothetical protein